MLSDQRQHHLFLDGLIKVFFWLDFTALRTFKESDIMTVKVIMPFIGDHFIGKEIIYFIKIAEMSEGYLSEFAVIGQEAPLLRALYNSFFMSATRSSETPSPLAMSKDLQEKNARST